MQAMPDRSVDELCELGQEQLIQTRYLEAEATLVRAESLAQAANDWDSLSRLYMPLQEARRQRRQRCGEGIVCLDLLARGPDDVIDPAAVLEKYPGGQLLVAGWGTIEPAIRIRELAAARQLYVEVFLAAVYGSGNSRIVLIAPEEDTLLPPASSNPGKTPMTNSLVLAEAELPRGEVKGTPQTYGRVMDIWERLHAPFLAAADDAPGLLDRVSGYRRTIRVDYACELAHQKLSAVARQLAREALA
jgi:hypothetical protein